MASFGSFAGLASAAVGALCSYESYALSLSDLSCSQPPPQAESAGQPSGGGANSSSPNSSKQDRSVDQQRDASSNQRRDRSSLKFAPEFDGLDWFETIIR